MLGFVVFLMGLAFAFSGVVGILRLPDFFSRLHAVGKVDTLGVTLMLLGLAISQPFSLTTIKLMLILVFIAMANPLVAHALGRSAWKAGLGDDIPRDDA